MEKDFSSFPPLSIIAYSDFYDEPDPKVWGDYWMKENLLKEFARIGYPLDPSRPEILVHLFGEPMKDLPPDLYKILWIHSHPDWVTPEILQGYDKVYCASPWFTKRLQEQGFDASFLMVPTCMEPVRRERKYDVVFVGNTRRKAKRKVVRDMGDLPYRIKIWGWGWHGLIPEEWYGGEYYENGRLNELYASAGIVLNDHHEDMAREGFVNPRVLDVLASGGFVISDPVRGIGPLLGEGVAVYEGSADLREKIAYFLRDETSREAFIQKGRDRAREYTYRSACAEITGHIESNSDKLFI